jgi:hypothetical protein
LTHVSKIKKKWNQVYFLSSVRIKIRLVFLCNLVSILILGLRFGRWFRIFWFLVFSFLFLCFFINFNFSHPCLWLVLHSNFHSKQNQTCIEFFLWCYWFWIILVNLIFHISLHLLHGLICVPFHCIFFSFQLASQFLFIFAPLNRDHLVGLLVVILDALCRHHFFLLLFVGIVYWSLGCGFLFMIVVFLSALPNCDHLVSFLIMVIGVHCHHFILYSSWSWFLVYIVVAFFSTSNHDCLVG